MFPQIWLLISTGSKYLQDKILKSGEHGIKRVEALSFNVLLHQNTCVPNR